MNKWVRRMVERARMSNGPAARHEPTLSELEAALPIDTLNLIEVGSQQAELFYRVAKLLAGLHAQRDKLLLEKEEAEAQARSDIRDSLTDRKLTVADMEAGVKLNPDVRHLAQRLLGVHENIGAVHALKDAYVQRKSSLTDLVELQRQVGAAIDPAVVKTAMTEHRRTYRR
jgi:hypothetical protein